MFHGHNQLTGSQEGYSCLWVGLIQLVEGHMSRMGFSEDCVALSSYCGIGTHLPDMFSRSQTCWSHNPMYPLLGTNVFREYICPLVDISGEIGLL